MNYADDFVVCGKAPAEAMRAAVERMMEKLRLPQRGEDPLASECRRNRWSSSGTASDANYSPRTGRAYIGSARAGRVPEHLPQGQ